MLALKIVNRERHLVDYPQPLTVETDPSTAEIGFLLVGHGTRRAAGQQQFRRLFHEFSNLVAPRPAELAFLELAEPDIPSAIKNFAARGVRAVVTVPVLLFSAGHAQQDIPSEVAAAASNAGLDVLAQSSALESCEPILELSATRFREAICRPGPGFERAPASCSDCCLGHYCPKISLVMIGRGSRSDSATTAMRQFTENRCQLTQVSWKTTGFIHAQSPSVTQALDEVAEAAAENGSSTIVVQPHLLFEGELIDNLRQDVAERQASDAAHRWVITETLGVDQRLAETLATLANSALRIVQA